MSPVVMKENAGKVSASEFDAARWSVVSSEDCAASSLSYDEAARLVQKMSGSISGLCIVTNEAANRLYGKQKPVENGRLPYVAAPNTFAETL